MDDAVTRRRTRQREYYQENKDHMVDRSRKWRANNLPHALWRVCKTRAAAKGIDFDLEVSDIVLPTHCPYLDIELYQDRQNGHSHSIDRVDNSKGYTKDNIEVISLLANRMKNSASKEQLIKFAERILEKNAK